MITYIILIFFCLFLVVFSYLFFKKDLLSPTLVSAIVFLLTLVCAAIGLFSWNYVDGLSLETILIIIVGLGSFCIGEIIARALQKGRTKEKKKKPIKPFCLTNKILIALLIFVIISLVLNMIEIVKVTESYGFTSSSFIDVLAYYRTKTGLFNDSAFASGAGINTFVSQLWKISGAINIILFYYGFQKILTLKKKINKKELILIALILIITLLQTFLFNGGRSIFFHYIVAYAAIIVFTLFVKGEKKVSRKIVRRFVGIIGVLVVIFYMLLPMVGRSTSHGMLEYTTFSLGVSVPSLELYIEDDESSEEKYVGEETFSGVYYTLNKIGVMKYTKARSHEWRSFADDSTLSSNTYTSLRSYYKDFGMAGVIILQFIFGFVVTFIYLKIKESNSMLAHIIYFSYFYILIDQARDEQFFSLISISTVANVAFIAITYYILRTLGSRNEKNKR